MRWSWGRSLRKKKLRARPLDADYIGFDIEDEFVVGYGLDYQGHYRNLPEVRVLPSNVSSVVSHK